MTLKMYVAAHKPSAFPEDDGYTPIQVGAARSDLRLGTLTDDQGDNISKKNETFCECTAMYWIWKNCKADVVGLSHYRRFFSHKSLPVRFNEHDIASSRDFEEIGNGVDLILGDVIGFINDITKSPISVEQQYFGTAIGFDLHLAREAIRRLSPQYLLAFDFVMRNCQLVPYNMFIGTRQSVSDYFEWLFPILFMLEELVPWNTYGLYQRRAVGFLAERLFTVWTVENRSKYRIASRPIVFCE